MVSFTRVSRHMIIPIRIVTFVFAFVFLDTRVEKQLIKKSEVFLS